MIISITITNNGGKRTYRLNTDSCDKLSIIKTIQLCWNDYKIKYKNLELPFDDYIIDRHNDLFFYDKYPDIFLDFEYVSI
jgi:hypothetical protein